MILDIIIYDFHGKNNNKMLYNGKYEAYTLSIYNNIQYDQIKFSYT